MALRRYIALEGKMGYVPDWYVVIQAAKYLNVAPWELLEAPVWWRDKALLSMTAEHEAQKIIDAHRK